MIVAIKNFKRNEASTLVAKSVKYFLPNIDIYLFNLYKDEINLDKIEKDLFKDIFNYETKYVLGPGEFSPNNGFYYSEAYNLIYDKFKDYNGKLLILDENHYFTNGNTLKELTDNEFDIAWAFWCIDMGEYVNASIFCMNPSKMISFPIPEIYMGIETLLKTYVMEKHNHLIKYELKNRNCDNYFGDGSYTNNLDKMKSDMKHIIKDNKMKLAVGLFGIHYEDHLKHWMKWDIKVDYKKSVENFKECIFLDHDVNIYSSTYFSEKVNELIKDYSFRSLRLAEIDNNYENDLGFNMQKRNRRFKETIKLILDDNIIYDYVLLTRYDIFFKQKIWDLDINYNEINVMYEGVWGNKIIDDNFYFMPYDKLQFFYDKVDSINEKEGSHYYYKHIDNINLIVKGIVPDISQVPTYFLTRHVPEGRKDFK